MTATHRMVSPSLKSLIMDLQQVARKDWLIIYIFNCINVPRVDSRMTLLIRFMSTIKKTSDMGFS